MPLAQVAATVRLHPFGRGTFITAALSAFSFAALPLAARELFGPGTIPSLLAIGCGCAVMAAGMWRFRADLNLAAMPGAAQLTAIAARRRDSKRNSKRLAGNSTLATQIQPNCTLLKGGKYIL